MRKRRGPRSREVRDVKVGGGEKHARGEDVVSRACQVAAPQKAGKNQKPPARDGNNQNRRALGDIGNTFNAGAAAQLKPPPQLSRPMTRGYQEELRDAQLASKKVVQPQPIATGEECAKGKSVVEAMPEEDPKCKSIVKALPKSESIVKAMPKSKSIVKAMPEENAKGKSRKEGKSITEAMPEDAVPSFSCKKRSSRGRTFARSSTLIARKQQALLCYSSERRGILSIHDQLGLGEYVEELYTHYRDVELECRPWTNYMKSQVELNPTMRSILVDWLVEVHLKFDLAPETLYLSVYIMDRYLSLKQVSRRHFQLLGIVSMLVAGKHEEIMPPPVNDFMYVTNGAFHRRQILSTEKDVLGQLSWKVTIPTAYAFVLKFLKIPTAISPADKEVAEHLVLFLSELGLTNYTILQFRASMLAAAALYVARSTLGLLPHWDKTLKRLSFFKASALQACARTLVDSHKQATEAKLRSVFRKYSTPQFSAVSLKDLPDKKTFDGAGDGPPSNPKMLFLKSQDD